MLQPRLPPVLFDSLRPLLGNVLARGTERAPDALAVSSDSRCLAFIGPSEFIVTIADAQSLDEVSRTLPVPCCWS